MLEIQKETTRGQTASGEVQRRTNRQRRDEKSDMYKIFMDAASRLPDDVRKAYLLRVFEDGMAKRWAKPYEMNQHNYETLNHSLP